MRHAKQKGRAKLRLSFTSDDELLTAPREEVASREPEKFKYVYVIQGTSPSEKKTQGT